MIKANSGFAGWYTEAALRVKLGGMTAADSGWKNLLAALAAKGK
jgi:hypothetical protein